MAHIALPLLIPGLAGLSLMAQSETVRNAASSATNWAANSRGLMKTLERQGNNFLDPVSKRLGEAFAEKLAPRTSSSSGAPTVYRYTYNSRPARSGFKRYKRYRPFRKWKGRGRKRWYQRRPLGRGWRGNAVRLPSRQWLNRQRRF